MIDGVSETDIKEDWQSMVYMFFDKKIESGAKVNVNEVLAQELNKPVIKNIKTRKMHVRFKDNI